jgi:hypothetical protein
VRTDSWNQAQPPPLKTLIFNQQRGYDMVKDWTSERKDQLDKLKTVLSLMEKVNRTTGAISDILKSSEIANELMYGSSNSESFWNFLCMELNKDKP